MSSCFLLHGHVLTTSSAPQSKRPIARALRVFSTDDNLPIIVHCSHGRDRTGIIIALLLRALGTDEHAVALDYAETDVRLQVRAGSSCVIVFGFARYPAQLQHTSGHTQCIRFGYWRSQACGALGHTPRTE